MFVVNNMFINDDVWWCAARWDEKACKYGKIFCGQHLTNILNPHNNEAKRDATTCKRLCLTQEKFKQLHIT